MGTMELMREDWPWRGEARFQVRHAASGLVIAERVVRNTITTAGKNLVRNALEGLATDLAIKRVAFGSGLGTLTTGLTSGLAYTTLAVTALAKAVANGESLTIQNMTSSQVVTASAAAAQGATSISVTSFTANANYAVGDAVTHTPAAGQTALDHEQYRKPVTDFSDTTDAQLVTIVYVNPTEGNGFLYEEVGWFAGAAAGDTAGSGVMVARLLYCRTDKTNLLSIEIDRTDSW